MKTEVVYAFADGGVMRKNPSPYGGTFAWVHHTDGIILRKDSGVMTPDMGVEGYVTNNVSELHAVCSCILAIPERSRAVIHSDSNVTLLRVFRNAKLNGVPEWLIKELNCARTHLNSLYSFRHVLLNGHPTQAELLAGKGRRGLPTSHWNVWCDTVCNEECEKHMKASAD